MNSSNNGGTLALDLILYSGETLPFQVFNKNDREDYINAVIIAAVTW